MARDDSSGFFMPPEAVKQLQQQAPDVLKEMETPSWPPRGYPGAEGDAALAAQLGKLLAEYVESSAEDHPYLPFVRAPEADGDADADDDDDDEELHGKVEVAEEGDEDEDEDGYEDEDEDGGETDGEGDPKLIMLGMEAEEIEDLRAENKNWWKEYWEKGEYEARLAAGKLMAERLEGVWLDVDDDASAKRGLASYEGTSKSGATVGLMAVRLDDGVEEDDE